MLDAVECSRLPSPHGCCHVARIIALLMNRPPTTKDWRTLLPLSIAPPAAAGGPAPSGLRRASGGARPARPGAGEVPSPACWIGSLGRWWLVCVCGGGGMHVEVEVESMRYLYLLCSKLVTCIFV